MKTGAAPLTLRQRHLVRESFATVRSYSNSFTKLFYGRLFEIAPSARGLFKHGIEEQSRKLLDMLSTIVSALDDLDTLRPQLAELGRKHVTYGAKAGDYDSVRRAILWALAHALEFEFDPETKSAWDRMLQAVSAVMLEGAEKSSGGDDQNPL
jgi:hemoglobin-like flavoprotein